MCGVNSAILYFLCVHNDGFRFELDDVRAGCGFDAGPAG